MTKFSSATAFALLFALHRTSATAVVGEESSTTLSTSSSSSSSTHNNLRHPSSQKHNNNTPLGRKLQFDFDSVVPCWLPFSNCEAANTCEAVAPLGADQFDLNQYIAKSWFIQKQQVNPYQSENDLYCVVATYNNNRENDDFLQVLNSANSGGVTGTPQNPESNSFFGSLCAEQVNGGALRVAPCFLTPLFSLAAGDYWVLAVAPDYSWAVVSGGQPDQWKETVNGRNFCTTSESEHFLRTNGSGLWLFTREKVASAATIATMEAKLTELGISTSGLKPVVQEGCTYPDTIKL